MSRVVVTGGGGFIGAYLVKRLVREGHDVVCLDNMARGSDSRFAEVADDVDLHIGDVRDPSVVLRAVQRAEVVFHLAAINGTENFYSRPEHVLDVGLRGALAVVEACETADVPDLVVASSAEVYQQPPSVPTDETVALMLPDSLNPRYSYGGSKIVTELIAFNYGRKHFRKLQAFRPHNVYGPDMGWKHVVPQFLLRAMAAREKGEHTFPIQSDGTETRAFAYVDDVVDGILRMHARGGHREVYHIGNDQEVSVRDLVEVTGRIVGHKLHIQPGPKAEGATSRRCPDIGKMRALGYDPQVGLEDGLRRTAEWYAANRTRQPENALM
ncbi:MAG: NAD-dependent epimerase/dehydratase family protein [Pseudomonadota bacterium]